MADWDSDEYYLTELLLHTHKIPVAWAAKFLNVTEERIRKGRVRGLRFMQIPYRSGADSWETKDLVQVVRVQQFIDWAKKDRPKVHQQIEAYYMDQELLKNT